MAGAAPRRMTASRILRAPLLREMLRSPEPSVRWRTRVRVLDEPRSTPRVRRLEEEVRRSPRVARLLTRSTFPTRAGSSGGIYRYYQGIHWALAALGDLGYPPEDPSIRPLLDRALAMWTHPRFEWTPSAFGAESGPAEGVVRWIAGRYRRCASQQGNALLYATRLAPGDARAPRLAALLERWQWEDGGWNCALSPNAHVSSFMETLTPMRGLAAYAASSGSSTARRAAERAAELFLARRLFRRRTNGQPMRSDFLRLHYPLYWHYVLLGGLKGLAELGRLGDDRCREALDWLEGRELPGGGWPADARYYRVSPQYRFGCEYVDWGAPSRKRRNDWVTTDALYVLHAAGRLAA